MNRWTLNSWKKKKKKKKTVTKVRALGVLLLNVVGISHQTAAKLKRKREL